MVLCFCFALLLSLLFADLFRKDSLDWAPAFCGLRGSPAARRLSIHMLVIEPLRAVTNALVNGPGSTGYPSMNYQEWTTICTADADTGTGAITHAMGPFARAFLKWLMGSAAITAAQLSLWWFSTYPATTTWAASKATTAGSGNASVQLRTELMRAA